MKTPFLMLILSLFIGLFVFSCNNESDFEKTPESIVTSQVDSLIITPEYQRYSQAAQELGTEIKFRYLALSESQKQEFKNKLAEILKNEKSNLSELQKLTEEVGHIIGINYNEEINTIKKLANGVLKGRDISRKEFIIALQKNNLKNNQNHSARNIDRDYAIFRCQTGCEMSYEVDIIIASQGNIAEEVIIGNLQAYYNLINCLEKC